MDPTFAGLLLLLVLSGAAAAAFVMGRRYGEAAERASASDTLARVAGERGRLESLAQRVPVLEREVAALRGQVAQAEADLAAARATGRELETRLADTQASAAEKLELLSRAEASLKEAFQALSADALDRSRAAFLDQARATFGEFRENALKEFSARETSFSQLVSPIRESLTRFEGQVADIEKTRAEAYSGLRADLAAFREGQKLLRDETEKLSNALRAPSARGRWGEFQLRRVVEMAGMVEHCDFVEQSGFQGDEGRLRPDLIVHLPGGKTVVVDAKVPLLAYLDAREAADEGERRESMQRHARQLRKHVGDLSGKAYAEQLPESPDFVVMYVPLESAFADAVQADPSLLDDAVAASVIPAGPMTLLSLLKGAAYGWRQERIAESAQQISELGRELYARLGVMASHLAPVGEALGRATLQYNKAVGSFESRVLVQARRFKDLGAATGDDLPEIETVSVAPRQLALPGIDEDPDEGEPGAGGVS